MIELFSSVGGHIEKIAYDSPIAKDFIRSAATNVLMQPAFRRDGGRGRSTALEFGFFTTS